MEQGFYHPDRGYWQTTGSPSLEILNSYPQGTISVPLKPGANYTWNGATWVQGPPPAIIEEQVIAERDRRIEAGTVINVTGIGDIPVSGRQAVQIDLQGLATAAQVMMAGGSQSPQFPFRDEARVVHMLTPAQVLELYMEGVQWIAQVRAAAWSLIDMETTPQDYTEDMYWP